MKLAVFLNSVKPIYEQLYDQIAAQILCGEMPAGSPLPSIRGVAKDLRISVITVKSAYERLERDGLIVTMQGKGCFVSDRPSGRDMRLSRAADKLSVAVEYCKELGLSEEEITALVSELYSR